MSYAPRPYRRSPSIRGSCGSLIPSTPTVSVWPHSSSVRPPPEPGARTTTLGRPGVASSTSASSPPVRAQSAMNAAMAVSPAAPGTSAGLTESIATSRASSSVST